jgi:hypothetical protein
VLGYILYRTKTFYREKLGGELYGQSSMPASLICSCALTLLYERVIAFGWVRPTALQFLLLIAVFIGINYVLTPYAENTMPAWERRWKGEHKTRRTIWGWMITLAALASAVGFALLLEKLGRPFRSG